MREVRQCTLPHSFVNLIVEGGQQAALAIVNIYLLAVWSYIDVCVAQSHTHLGVFLLVL